MFVQSSTGTSVRLTHLSTGVSLHFIDLCNTTRTTYATGCALQNKFTYQLYLIESLLVMCVNYIVSVPLHPQSSQSVHNLYQNARFVNCLKLEIKP